MLVIINIAMSVVIYLPFFKMYDRKMVEMEKSDEATVAPSDSSVQM